MAAILQMTFWNARGLSVHAPSQRETTLYSNVVSHWLDPYTELSLNVVLNWNIWTSINISLKCVYIWHLLASPSHSDFLHTTFSDSQVLASMGIDKLRPSFNTVNSLHNTHKRYSKCHLRGPVIHFRRDCCLSTNITKAGYCRETSNNTALLFCSSILYCLKLCILGFFVCFENTPSTLA